MAKPLIREPEETIRRRRGSCLMADFAFRFAGWRVFVLVLILLPGMLPASPPGMPPQGFMGAASKLPRVAGQSLDKSPARLSAEETQALIRRVLQTELTAAQETSKDAPHPMQYRIHKVSPRLSTTKQIIETKDGDVARLMAINDAPLSVASQQTEDARLDSLLTNPGQQQHRQQREQGDAERARKILRALPDAFLYEYAGIVPTPHGPSYRFTFEPNANFNPQDIEAQVLKAMAGELWIDIAQQRVTRLEGKRLHDVEYGWGLVGKLEQGGTLLLEQANVGDGQWRTVHMTLVMNARIFFKTVRLDTTLDLTQFTPVPSGLDYREAIRLLQGSPGR